jgi:uncharacterized protein YdhG (YjbR/CyaY superfamily)
MRRMAGTVEDYLAQLDPAEAAELAVLVARLRGVLPDAAETLQWGMPAWVGPDGTMLAGVAAQKSNLALYLCPAPGEDPFRAWREKLPKSAIGKGCLRFRRLDLLPEGMIESIMDAIAAKG